MYLHARICWRHEIVHCQTKYKGFYFVSLKEFSQAFTCKFFAFSLDFVFLAFLSCLIICSVPPRQNWARVVGSLGGRIAAIGPVVQPADHLRSAYR